MMQDGAALQLYPIVNIWTRTALIGSRAATFTPLYYSNMDLRERSTSGVSGCVMMIYRPGSGFPGCIGLDGLLRKHARLMREWRIANHFLIVCS